VVHRLLHGTAASGDHLDPGGLQRAERVGAALPGEHVLHPLLGHQLRRLDTHPMRRLQIRILDHLAAHVIGIDDSKARGPTEPGIDPRLQRSACG